MTLDRYLPQGQSQQKIRPEHLDRAAAVYVRQSSRQQVLDHSESTRLQYALAERAVALGWARSQVTVIDDDLGVSAAGARFPQGLCTACHGGDDGTRGHRPRDRDVPAGADRPGLAPAAGAVLPVGGAARRSRWRLRSRVLQRPAAASGWQYAVAVKGGTSAYDCDAVPQARPYGGLGQPPKPAYPAPPATVRQLALAHADQVRPVTWRHGTKTSAGSPEAAMTSSFLVIRVRPASRHITRAADRSLPACWLLAEWPPEAAEPSGYWLSTLPEDTPAGELVRLAKIRWRIEHDYRELKHGLGLDHFEGRSYLGWNRHVTLAVLVQAFCTMLRTDPKADAPG